MDNTPRKDTEGFAIPALPNGVPQDVMEIMAMIEADAAGGAMSVEVEDSSSTAELENAIVSKSEAEGTANEPAQSTSTPMTAERHAELLAQLTSFVSGSAPSTNGIDEVGYITEDSDDVESDDEGMEVEPIDLEGLRALMEAKRREEVAGEDKTEEQGSDGGPEQASSDDDESSSDSSDSDSSDSDSDEDALPERLAQVDMLSDDGDEPTPSGPLKTEHEILEEPVGVPPFERLAKGSRMVLAGEVVSFVRDPAVGVWQEWTKREAEKEAERAEKEEGESKVGGVEDASTPNPAVEKAPESEMEGRTDAPTTDAPVENATDVPQVSEPAQGEVADQEEGQIEETPVETAPIVEQVSVDQAPIVDAETVDEKLTAPEAPVAGTSEAKPVVTDDLSEPKPTRSEPSSEAPAPTSAKRPRNRRGGKKNGPAKPSGPPMPKSSGTIVVQAQRPPAGTVKGGTDRVDEDGWLLDGSVICTGEGQAVAVVAEVFGPTAQPFYLLKLPPPPFPVPSADELTRGTKLYYPAEGDHAYVPVRMLKTDKRFKGTDASNLYDEELAEHEMEWSDDEEEQAAKRKLKADRKGKKTGDRPSGRQPHFDTASTAGGSDDEMSVHYGGAGDASMRDDRSEAGFSVASSSARSRRVPQSYGDLYDDQASVGYREPAGRGRGRGRGAPRGAAPRPVSDRFGDAPPTQAPPRNQDGGRQIGRGAGRGRGAPERGRGRGQSTRGGAPQRGRQDAPARHVPPASANLPARPRDLSPTSAHIARVTGAVQTPQQPQQQPMQQQPPFGMMGMPSFGWNPQAGMGGMQMPMSMPMGMGMPGMFPTPFFPMQPQAQQGTGMSGSVNPALMQQYQQVREQYQQMVARYQGHQGQPPPSGGA